MWLACLALLASLARAEDLSVTWMGQSSTRIQVGDQVILTDPVEAPALFHGLFHRKRSTCSVEGLPPPGLVLLSHLHDDHFDPPTLRRVPGREAALLVTPRGSSSYLPGDLGYGAIVELDPWEQVERDRVKVTAVPVRHLGGTHGWDAAWNRSYTGYLVEKGDRALLFVGDSAFSRRRYRAVAERAPALDLALLPMAPVVGPFVSFMHQGPHGAFRALDLLDARHMIPIHHGTYWSRDRGALRRFDRRAAGDDRVLRGDVCEPVQVP